MRRNLNLGTLLLWATALLFAGFLILFGVVVFSEGAIVYRYVDATLGDDTAVTPNIGTPWKTLAKVYAERASMDPGSFVYLKCGETWRERLIARQAGTVGLPITYTSYGTGEKPIIDGSVYFDDVWVNTAGDIYKHTFDFTTSHANGPERAWQQSTDLIRNYATPTTPALGEYGYVDETPDAFYVNVGHAPVANEIRYTFMENCVVTWADYNTFDGLHFTRADGSMMYQWDLGADYVIVQNCLFDYGGSAGIATRNDAILDANYWTVRNNVFNDGAPHEYASNARHPIYPQGADGWVIEHNTFTHNMIDPTKTNTGNQAYGITWKDCINGTIRYNYFYNYWGGAIEFAQYITTGTGAKDNLFAYNIAYNCRRLVLTNSDDAANFDNTGNKIYNNVWYYDNATVAPYSAINNGKAITDLDVKNNIFWTSLADRKMIRIENAAGVLQGCDYNCYKEGLNCIQYGAATYYSTIADFFTNKGFDEHSIPTDPAWVTAPTNFRLTSASPCINTGTDVSLTSDYIGTVVPKGAAQDMGAYEYDPPAPVSIGGPHRIQIW